MTEVNLTHDPILLLLLKNIIRASSRISVHDTALNQRVAELTYFDQHPSQVTYENLVTSIDKLAEVLHGYQLTNEKDSPDEEPSGPDSLPDNIFKFKTKLTELKIKTDLDSKHFTLAELEVKVEHFFKLAATTEIECPACHKKIKCPTKFDDEGELIDVPEKCPHCHHPVENAYDNIGFGGEY